MKYRIKKERRGESVYFYPQYKYKFWPFWLSPKTSYSGFDWSPVVFYTKECALNWINIREENKNIKTTIKYEDV